MTRPTPAEEAAPGQPGAAAGVERDAVASLAYQLYETEGRPEGRQIEHWLKAELLLRQENQPGSPVALRPDPGDPMIVRLEILERDIDDLNLDREQKIEEQLQRVIDTLPRPNVVVDFANVAHMGSSMIGALVGFNRRVRNKGGHVRVVNPQPLVYEELRLCRLDKVLDLGPAPGR